jgi:hypothetical protein
MQYFILFIITLLTLFISFITIVFLYYIVWSNFIIRVPTIRTKEIELKKLIEYIGVNKHDTVYDFGSGVGSSIFLIKTLTNATTVGYERNSTSYLLSVKNKFFSKNQTTLIRKNFLTVTVPKETIVYTYLFPFVMKKINSTYGSEILNGNLSLISCDYPLDGIPCKVIKTGKHRFFLYGKRFIDNMNIADNTVL